MYILQYEYFNLIILVKFAFLSLMEKFPLLLFFIVEGVYMFEGKNFVKGNPINSIPPSN